MASNKGFGLPKISQSKLKAFSIGRMNVAGKGALTKKQKEELRKKEEEQKAAEVFNDFVATFEGDQSVGKTFIRGDVINPEKLDESQRNSPKVYKPTAKLQEIAKSVEKKLAQSSLTKYDNVKPSNKKKDTKKKSNLELFKEELKYLQAEREIRHTVKNQGMQIEAALLAGSGGVSTPPVKRVRRSRFQPAPIESELDLSQDSLLLDSASLDCGDPQSTNLFLGNVPTHLDEKAMCEIFGKYGPLASVKIMWPRTQEEKSRSRNCAFVAFMTRKDAERAKRNLDGKTVRGYDMKLGWGKTVPIPPRPFYIPPRLLEKTLPPPPSGLPFNAQPRDPDKRSREPGVPPEFRDKRDFEETLANSVVRVVIPTERNLITVIHRTIEFVVREGPMFEAMVMNKEINNPIFRFLFENQSPAHIYYRWKMYSILHGETATKWRTSDFRMFKGGSIWRPPPINPYTTDRHSSSEEEENHKSRSSTRRSSSKRSERDNKVKKDLKDDDRDALEDILRHLEPRQSVVADAMVFCLEHAESGEEIVECITESLSITSTPLPKKIARLYLISDILHNCSAKISNASFFRKHFEERLEQVMESLHKCHCSIQGRLKAEQFKHRVMNCFRAWEDWAVYPDQLLIKLQNTFLGLVSKPKDEDSKVKLEEEEDTMDGVPLEEEKHDDDVDGIPLDDKKEEDDVDGLPIDGEEDVDGEPLEDTANPAAPRFVASKWETVDPTEVEAQAMTTSKWDLLENDDEDGSSDNEGSKKTQSSQDDSRLIEIGREKLRDIEVKVMKYQDDLESGRREKSHLSISTQVEQYRQKLLEKEREAEKTRREKEKRKRERKSKNSSGDSEGEVTPHHKRKKKKDRDSPRPSGLVSYDSDDSSGSYHHHSSSKKRTNSSRRRSRSRSRSRERYSRRKRSRSRSPRRSKRSRSRERRKKKKR